MDFYYDDTGTVSKSKMHMAHVAPYAEYTDVVTTNGIKYKTNLYLINRRLYVADSGNVVVYVVHKAQYVELLNVKNWCVARMLGNSIAMEHSDHIFDGVMIRKCKRIYFNTYENTYMGEITTKLGTYRIEQSELTKTIYLEFRNRYIICEKDDFEDFVENLQNYLESEEGIVHIELY